ncbi:MAG: metallophosphatase family protein, partial [Promicromonosporaceae bacterium]|nr:metallophosphatase family protein [Promicromonosporaceae bacterium]
AALAGAANLGVEQYWNLGDMVGYYPRAAEVVARCRELPGQVIQGNHERLLRDVAAGTRPLAELDAKYGLGHRRALADLPAADLRWLLDLPVEAQLVVDGLAVTLVHGTPGHPDRRVYPDASLAEFAEIVAGHRTAWADREDSPPPRGWVFGGHTHYELRHDSEDVTVINVGSVGQPRNRGGHAAWGLLDTATGEYLQVHTPYDVSAVETEVRAMGGPNQAYLLGVLRR